MALKAIEENKYPTEISLLEEGEPVKGGVDGPDNRALIQLANRTNWLKLKIEDLVNNPPTGGGGSNLPELPEDVPYWSFLGIVKTTAGAATQPVEGYPDYSYVLCQGHVWAIIDRVWTDMGSFVPPSAGLPVLPEGQPYFTFLGVISDPDILTQVPASMFPDYSYVLTKGHMWAAVSGSWVKMGSFESGEGGGGEGGGGTPFPEAPIDGVPYVRKDGAWEAFYPNRNLVRYLTETSTLDPNICVFWTLDNTMPDLKTINLKNGPGRYPDMYDYGIAVTLIVTGIAGELKFVPETNVDLFWHKGPQPMLYAGKTVFILLWDGNGWIGSTGAQVPSGIF